uniref:Protein FAM161A n=2 Tax=Oryctolagus cuniculus TaxID=9986 RepID=A0A5F9CE43_RABIT
METMAKLEKLYHNKLNLKDVQPVIVREDVPSVSSSSVSEKNYYHPISLMTSLSEPDLGRSSSYTSSEEELPNLEKDSPRKTRVMSYAKELINNMWTNFQVKDYIQGEDAHFQAVGKPRRRPKEWVPRITVPQPFQMMIREQKKKETMKSKSDIEVVHKLLKKQEEEKEFKKFRANPVPEYVFLPLYRDIVKQNEERRRSTKEKNKEALLASQKPFKFIAREEQKQAAREKQLRDFFKSKKKTHRFKARPVPRSIYSSIASDKLKEEDQHRNFRAPTRAQELVQNSSPLSLKPAYRRFRSPGHPAQAVLLKHKARSQPPDYEDSPKTYLKLPSEYQGSKLLTDYGPFDVQPSSSAIKRETVLADIKADEENLKETRWPYMSPRRKSPVKSAGSKRMPCNCNPPMPTASSRARGEAIRKSEKERMRQYRQELEEREEKLKMRPLLFERVAQKNARMAAEKHYSNTLKALGISDEFVSRKGQSGKVLECFANEESQSFSEDKESLHEEEKIEERENGEESYFVDANSQDSCKEEAEAEEESEEKPAEE